VKTFFISAIAVGVLWMKRWLCAGKNLSVLESRVIANGVRNEDVWVIPESMEKKLVGLEAPKKRVRYQKAGYLAGSKTGLWHLRSRPIKGPHKVKFSGIDGLG